MKPKQVKMVSIVDYHPTHIGETLKGHWVLIVQKYRLLLFPLIARFPVQDVSGGA
jgi:hypothetical protein